MGLLVSKLNEVTEVLRIWMLAEFAHTHTHPDQVGWLTIWGIVNVEHTTAALKRMTVAVLYSQHVPVCLQNFPFD